MASFRGFSFNLLPPPSKEELKKQEQRDSNSVYMALFPLIAAFLWIVLVLVNAIFLQDYIDGWNEKIKSQENEIITYNFEKRTNGELFEKTKVLEPVITKHIVPEEFFKLVEERILETSPDTIIQNYGRTESGTFSFTADAANYEQVAKIIYAFTSDSNFTNVQFRNVNLDTRTNVVTFTLEFSFIGSART